MVSQLCVKVMPLNRTPALMSRSIAAASQADLVLFLLMASLLAEWVMQYRVAAQSSKDLPASLLGIE